jgi:hypothetical protein
MGIEVWVTRPGVFVAVTCTCVAFTTAALGEAWMIGKGSCPVHRDVCAIEVPFSPHSTERLPAPGPESAYLGGVTVSGTGAYTIIAPAGSLTITPTTSALA